MNEELEKKVIPDEEITATEAETVNDPAKPECGLEEDLLADKAALLKTQLEEVKNRYLRLQADFSNYKRRVQKEKEDLFQMANSDLISKLLPVLDSLEKAEEMGDSGVLQIFKQLRDVLEKEGLKPIEAVGKPFDPTYHQAIDQVVSDEYEAGTVVEDLRKGYCFCGNLIRPSMVRVAK